MTIPQPFQIPASLPILPPVDEDLKSQIHTHSSSISTNSPIPYNRLALLGGASLLLAVTKILFNYTDNHTDFLEPAKISELRCFYVSTRNVSSWGRAYEFDENVIIAQHLLPLKEESQDRFAAATFEAYLGAVVLRDSQETVTTFIAELIAPSLAKMKAKGTTPVDTFAVQKLNEKLKSMGLSTPEWLSKEEGETVDDRFEVKCIINGKFVAKANARSIVEGKRKAATLAMHKPERFFTGLKDIK
jgi:dsRNA-specific ribonuclease